MRYAITLIILGVFFPAHALGTDAGREKHWSDLLEGNLERGQAVWLNTADEQKFLAIQTPDVTGKQLGALIILHDMGQHPNWPEVVAPLRKRLPDAGWSTLSIQMPVLQEDQPLSDYGPLFDEVGPRLDAAIAHAQDTGTENIVIVGYGLGASMGAAYLAAAQDTPVDAFIAIAMGAVKGGDPRMDSTTSLEDIQLPMLDIYGSRDFNQVIDSAPRRATAARRAGVSAQQQRRLDALRRSATAQSPFTKRSGYIAYRQVKIPGADHYFTTMENSLIKRIRGWLSKHVAGPGVR